MNNVDPKFLDSIWIPDFYIYDLQSFKGLKMFRDVGAGVRVIKHKGNAAGSLELEQLKHE